MVEWGIPSADHGSLEGYVWTSEQKIAYSMQAINVAETPR